MLNEGSCLFRDTENAEVFKILALSLDPRGIPEASDDLIYYDGTTIWYVLALVFPDFLIKISV